MKQASDQLHALLLDERAVEAVAKEGEAMHALLCELFPLSRSITGAGLRATVRRLGEVCLLYTSRCV